MLTATIEQNGIKFNKKPIKPKTIDTIIFSIISLFI